MEEYMKKLNIYDGIFPALLTPFDSNEQVNHIELKKMVNYLEKFPFRGFYVGGSTGEGMVMTYQERKEVFKTVIDNITNNTILPIAHIGAPSTLTAIDMGLYAKSLGYPIVSAVAPYYYPFKTKEIIDYYKTLSQKIGLPFIIYNYPGASNYSLNSDAVMELFQDTNFIGIKHTSYDLFSLSTFRQIKPYISIYNGFDEVLLGGLTMGASGGIGSTYNIIPNTIIEIFKNFQKGELEKASQLQKKACNIINVLIKHGVMPSEKYLLSKKDIFMGNCRHPFTKLSEIAKKELDQLDLY